jgi:acyl-CoA synthetase (AMP-forming)/AMP-acid ligase II
MPSSRRCNVAWRLLRMATLAANERAVVVPVARDRGGRAIYAYRTFAEMNALSDRYASGLSAYGLRRGMRVLLMVRPGFDFIALVFALFKMGVQPVLIDPGMGLRRLLECIQSVDAHGMIAVPLAHVVRLACRRRFAGMRYFVTVGRAAPWGGETLDRLARSASDRFEMTDTRADEPAAILFTSGSTGPAKGVVYEHGMFDAQVDLIQRSYGMMPGEIDLPTFPLFALFSAAMGMTSVIPDMDPSRPARVRPARIVEAIRDQHVTTSFGSPAMWRRVARYCVEHHIRLPSLRRVLIAGAPVAPAIIEDLRRVLDPVADVHTPYGATESLPVSSISGRELLRHGVERTRLGAGTCVGSPMLGVDVRIIRINDDTIPAWSDDLLVPDGEIGELAACGPAVTKEYYGRPDATAAAKIRDGDRIFHRIGDVGYRDADGRLWFCGRKAHRVTTPDGVLYTDQCEPIFNRHPDVARSALVGVGAPRRQVPVMVIEPHAGRFPRPRRAEMFRRELLELARSCPHTSAINRFLFHPSLPVDVRHNAKINREALATWAARRVR